MSFVQCTEGYIMPLTISIEDIRLLINSQLQPNLNTSHTRKKRRRMHKISIFAFVVLLDIGLKFHFRIHCNIVPLMGHLEVLTFSRQP